jgi:hypothetical protein
MGSSASLDRSPKKNWVENSGELPAYVREIARSIEKTGKTLEQSISIAISRIKVWAAGGDGVSAKTQAKAAKALAEWEALKAKNKSRSAGKKVKASWVEDLDEAADLVSLAASEVLIYRLSAERDDSAGTIALARVLGASTRAGR